MWLQTNKFEVGNKVFTHQPPSYEAIRPQSVRAEVKFTPWRSPEL